MELWNTNRILIASRMITPWKPLIDYDQEYSGDARTFGIPFVVLVTRGRIFRLIRARSPPSCSTFVLKVG